VDKHNTSKAWKALRKRLVRLLKDVIRLSEKKDLLSVEVFHRLKELVYFRLDQLLETTGNNKEAKRLIKRLYRHRKKLLTFLEYKGVSSITIMLNNR
jgi:hypothetical protein